MSGCVEGAWQPRAGSGSAHAEFVELRFAAPMWVAAVEIYETCAAGSLSSIAFWSPSPTAAGEGGGLHSGGGGAEGASHGRWDVVWRSTGGGGGSGMARSRDARLFTPEIAPRPYATQFVRLELSAHGVVPATTGRTPAAGPQIDAVRLVGLRAPQQDAARDPPARRDDDDMRDGIRGARSDGGRPASATRWHKRQPVPVAASAPAQVQHQREMRHLRAYVDTLKAYGESLRVALDASQADLRRAHAELERRDPYADRSARGSWPGAWSDR